MRLERPTVSRNASAVLLGFAVAGIATYGFLVTSARAVGPARYASLSALWSVVVLVGPGFFQPLEQELARAVAVRRGHGDGTAPVVRSVLLLGGGVAAALCVVAIGLSPVLLREVLDQQVLLFAAFIGALFAFCGLHVVRGVLAGSGRFGPYAALTATESLLRLVAAVVLLLVGVDTPGPFGVVITAGTAVATLLAWPGSRALVTPGPPAKWQETTRSLGSLLAAGVLAQVVLNAAPLTVKVLASSREQEVAGRFLAALVLARIPLFLFQAVQAVLLPSLVSAAERGDTARFRATLRTLVSVIVALGALATAVAYAVGPEVVRGVFGAGFSLHRSDLGYLVAGTVAYMLALVLTQGLIALRGQSRVVVGWALGVAAFTATVPLSSALLFRAELAFLVGSCVAAGSMAWFVVARIRTPWRSMA